MGSENQQDELALPLRGRKRDLTRDDFLAYYGEERLALPRRVIDALMAEFEAALPDPKKLIAASFLPAAA